MSTREVSGLQDDLLGTNWLSDLELPSGLDKEVAMLVRELPSQEARPDNTVNKTLSQFGELTLCDSPAATNNAHVERNLAGNVSQVVYPNGDRKSFEYGSDGLLMRVEYKDGSFWKKEDSTWTLYDHRGRKTDVTLGRDDIVVDKDGNFIFILADGGTDTTTPAGAALRRDKDGHITQIAYPDGEIKEFKYADDKLVEYRFKDGHCSWKLDGDTWNLYDQHGVKAGETMGKDRVWVERDGTFVFYDATTRQLTKTKTDGCTVKE